MCVCVRVRVRRLGALFTRPRAQLQCGRDPLSALMQGGCQHLASPPSPTHPATSHLPTNSPTRPPSHHTPRRATRRCCAHGLRMPSSSTQTTLARPWRTCGEPVCVLGPGGAARGRWCVCWALGACGELWAPTPAPLSSHRPPTRPPTHPPTQTPPPHCPPAGPASAAPPFKRTWARCWIRASGWRRWWAPWRRLQGCRVGGWVGEGGWVCKCVCWLSG